MDPPKNQVDMLFERFVATGASQFARLAQVIEAAAAARAPNMIAITKLKSGPTPAITNSSPGVSASVLAHRAELVDRERPPADIPAAAEIAGRPAVTPVHTHPLLLVDRRS